jgi:hypothetical protein
VNNVYLHVSSGSYFTSYAVLVKVIEGDGSWNSTAVSDAVSEMLE